MIVQEYVPGGELYDRITPDFGLEESTARDVFGSLVSVRRFIIILTVSSSHSTLCTHTYMYAHMCLHLQ